MSPRAAWRLEDFGFRAVYDYTGGKADWLAAGLPTEGRGHARRVTSAMETPPATQRDHNLTEVVARTRAIGWDICVVVNNQNIVIGVLRLDRMEPAPIGRAEELMEPGTTTIRADADLEQTLNRMSRRNVGNLVVSTPEGGLLGVLRRPRGPA